MDKLYAIHSTEDGVTIEEIKDWETWIREHSEDVSAEYQPQFSTKLPGDYGYTRWEDWGENEYVLIRGKIVVPKAVQVVTKYERP